MRRIRRFCGSGGAYISGVRRRWTGRRAELLPKADNKSLAETVSVAEAAHRLGQRRPRLYRWIASGFLPSAAVQRRGRPIRIVWPVVEGWLIQLKGEAFPLDYATGDPSQAPVAEGRETR
jgi:excisionase family DNA binding protein